ncbi:YheC/YheD family protein [Aneurinibacillus sp. Ricciae_BoGa-3]|uniref:YheC/YheD family protein n=1 Tax=Aneurinibacillus sp. Ricciae_BoGa-3 TaxID=3022697 RepID=UPI0023420A0A|nr:YheC/YheD family protein [Aneurinibacillus sp. Ricciae_BoGa-3]WCK56608.1 YheC/YheD family protein [Aneurinibacillus sp. Ricciae_BoGa-3]
MPLRRIKGKLIKGKAMLKHPVLKRYIPEFHALKPGVRTQMMKRYHTLFIKPDKGSQGKGIVRLKKLKNGKVQISLGLRHTVVKKFYVKNTLTQLLHPKKTYLIQQGLKLAKYKNRLIDIRVFMQKPNDRWLISGRVVRIGAAGRFTTNYHQGGQPETLEVVLRSIYKNQPKKINPTIRSLDRICTMTARVLDRRFPGIRQLGIDVAIDSNGRLWIIEANTNPAFLTFKNLKDKTMYYRILRRRRYIYSKYR